MKKRILYVGNNLLGKNHTYTGITSLTHLLRTEGYSLFTSSSKENKFIRILDMINSFYLYRKKVDFILIDTYSTLNFWYAVILGFLAQMYKIPYIPILHGGNLPSRLIRNRKISKNLFSNAYINIAPSNYLMKVFKKEGYNNIKYIPNTIELTNYSYKQRKELRPKLLWVRSFSEIYNPLMALQVLQQMLKTYPKAQLCMIGPARDNSFNVCTAFAKENSLPVNFTGKLSKVAWIAKSTDYDIFLNTTNFDNTPVSVIEAMALGLPVISTNVGGIPFLIDNGKDGLLCEANDIDEFTAKITQLIEEERVALDLTINARNKVLTFDWTVVKTLWNEVLS